jgi:hypothetical protein
LGADGHTYRAVWTAKHPFNRAADGYEPRPTLVLVLDLPPPPPLLPPRSGANADAISKLAQLVGARDAPFVARPSFSRPTSLRFFFFLPQLEARQQPNSQRPSIFPCR